MQATEPLSPSPAAVRPRLSAGALALAVSAGILAAPTLMLVARRSWATEQGQYGVIALALGAFFLARAWPAMAEVARPGPWLVALAGGLAAGAALLLGRLSGEYLLEAYALYGLGLALILVLMGWRALGRGGFPLAYLLLALPAPFAVLWPLSSGLRTAIAGGVVELLGLLGWAVGRDGLSLFVGSHRIDIEQACSGMNSLISLTAVALAYLHLRRAPRPTYYLLMAVPIVGAAVLANFVRVLVLVLLVQGIGEAVLGTFAHELAGFVTFASALLAVVGLDALIGRRFEARRR